MSAKIPERQTVQFDAPWSQQRQCFGAAGSWLLLTIMGTKQKSRFFCRLPIMLIAISFAADFHNLPALKRKCLLVNIVIKTVRMSSSSTDDGQQLFLLNTAGVAEFGRIFGPATFNYFP